MNPTSRTSHTAAPTDRLLLTVEEAAQRLGIGRTLAYALVRDGRLPSVTLGRLRRIPAHALQSWVDDLTEARTR